jgi:4-alpha-glucanotransferase
MGEFMATFTRAAGVLMHPTSLPGAHGIGSLGEEAHQFIDAIKEAGFKLWQILPLAPVAYGNSPYAAYSAFACNPLLINCETLVAEGWLKQKDITPYRDDQLQAADFDAAAAWKMPTLLACYRRFLREADAEAQQWFADFCEAKAEWLDDYALFMALKEDQDGAAWMEWPKPLRDRDQAALAKAGADLKEEIGFQKFLQFLFHRQWEGIRNHCKEADIKIVGDVPLYVAQDSADVWMHQKLFYLNPEGQPTVVSGCPPDYFCETGQLWGNPIYRWDVHKKTGYNWWLARLRTCFEQTDIVRIDHFRGLEAYWEVPAEDETAENGTWIPGPGKDLLTAMQKEFGELPIIAEDLGTITQEVHDLREEFDLPGMRVLQFGFTGEDPRTALHAPHTYVPDSVAYSGTHDNDTTTGWFYGQDHTADLRDEEQRENERRNFLEYIDSVDDEGVHWKMIRLCFSSVADTAIVPVQDILGLGSDARMNRPGYLREDNWAWRLTPEQLDTLADTSTRDTLRTLIWRYGRMGE